MNTPRPTFGRLAVIGVGLLGGSFALAARRAGLVGAITGFSTSASTLELALDRGVIDAAAVDAAEAVRNADLVLVAVPVAATAAVFDAIAPALRADTLLLDVGSTKADVVAAAARLGARAGCLVPSHPIAGAECSGVAHADAALFDGRRTIVCPLPDADPAQTARAEAVWRALGCADVLTMTALQHDACFAAVSHLPHLLAFAYLDGLLAQTDGPAAMALAGSGFRDFSRIGGGDPVMWRDVLLANAEPVLQQLGAFRTALDRLEARLRAGDAAGLQQAIAAASAVRRAWDRPAPDDSAHDDRSDT